jgi:hypothetical protein
MRRLFSLPLLALAFACSDGNPLLPDDEAFFTSESLIVSHAPGQNAKWSFHSEVTFVGPVGEPVIPRPTPSGVLHSDGLYNEFEMNGDLNGSWFFIGKAQANPKNGMGRSLGALILVDITGSDLGVGTFECKTSAKIENYPDFATFIQYGNVTGCKGTGAFEGRQMKAYVTNKDHPGLITGVYEFSGEIW